MDKRTGDLALSDLISVRYGHASLTTRLLAGITPTIVFQEAMDNISHKRQ